jgi:hypothetical protein
VDGLWIEGRNGARVGLLDAIAAYLDPLVPGWAIAWLCPLDVPDRVVLDVQERAARVARNAIRWPLTTIRAAIARAAFFAPVRERAREEEARAAVEAARVDREARRARTCRHVAALLERTGAALELRGHVRAEITEAEWRAVEESRETLAALFPALERGDASELELAEAACHAAEYVDRLDVIEAELADGEPLQAAPAQRVILPPIDPSNVSPEGQDRGPSPDAGYIALCGPLARREGRERGPEAMSRDPGVDPGPEGGSFDRFRDRPPSHPIPDPPPLVDPGEQGISPVGALDPREGCPHGARVEAFPEQDRHDGALALGVGFRRGDPNLDPLLHAGHVAHVEGGEFGTAEPARNPKEDQGAIAASRDGDGARRDHGPEFRETEWTRLLSRTLARLRSGRAAEGRPDDRGLDG